MKYEEALERLSLMRKCYSDALDDLVKGQTQVEHFLDKIHEYTLLCNKLDPEKE